MRKIAVLSILLCVCLVCLSCSRGLQEPPYTDPVSEETETTTVDPPVTTTPVTEETTAQAPSTEKAVEKPVTFPTLPPTIATAAPITTAAPPTTAAPTVPPQPTKPPLTLEIEDAVIDHFVQLHASDIQAIEEKHEANIAAIIRESEEYELDAMIKLRQLRELGYENTGAYQTALTQIEYGRQQITQKYNQENTRYENEKMALLYQMQAEIDQYLYENFEF
mgnify:CR=1 FL=1